MKPTKQTKPQSRKLTTMVASSRGEMRRWIGLTPMTRIASISSRMVREPRSAAMADPTAPASSSEVTSGAPCRMTPRPVAAPENEVAPIWPAMLETWMDTITPMGMATSSVGNTDVDDMNAH